MSCTGTRRRSGPICSLAAAGSPPSTRTGANFIDDVGVGDLWNFPAGIPHSIQGLEEGCEFLLVFDDGHFSENETFLLTDWLKHTPRSVLAKNFGLPETAFANLPTDPDYQRYMFAGTVPGSAGQDAVQSPAGTVPLRFSHHMLAQKPIKVAGGQVRITDSTNFPRPPPLPRRWWRSSRARCASCTGTPTPTSGSTTSPDRGA